MRQVIYLPVLLIVCLFVLLSPFTTVSVGGVERFLRRIGSRPVIGWVVDRIIAARRRHIQRRVRRLVAVKFFPLMTEVIREGFRSRGATRNQTVLEHAQRQRRDVEAEAKKEGYSENDVFELGTAAICHDVVEGIIGRDRVLFRGARFTPEGPEWVPEESGGVAKRRLRRYLEERPKLEKVLSEESDSSVARETLRLCDEASLNTEDPKWILFRDAHVKGDVVVAIELEADPTDLYVEANVIVDSPRIRAEIQRAFQKWSEKTQAKIGGGH